MKKTIHTVPFGYAKNEVESVFALLTSKISILEGDVKYLKAENERLLRELERAANGQPFGKEIIKRSEVLKTQEPLHH